MTATTEKPAVLFGLTFMGHDVSDTSLGESHEKEETNGTAYTHREVKALADGGFCPHATIVKLATQCGKTLLGQHLDLPRLSVYIKTTDAYSAVTWMVRPCGDNGEPMKGDELVEIMYYWDEVFTPSTRMCFGFAKNSPWGKILTQIRTPFDEWICKASPTKTVEYCQVEWTPTGLVGSLGLDDEFWFSWKYDDSYKITHLEMTRNDDENVDKKPHGRFPCLEELVGFRTLQFLPMYVCTNGDAWWEQEEEEDAWWEEEENIRLEEEEEEEKEDAL